MSKIISSLKNISPVTDSQKTVFESFFNKNLVLSGSAGTGKSFISIYLSLKTIFSKNIYQNLIICRSAVPTREIGFLPGTLEEKLSVYEQPYKDIFKKLISGIDFYDKMKEDGNLIFMSSSFTRGLTFDNSIVIIDEAQNLSFHELSSITTRLGNNCKLIICCDYIQSDLTKEKEKNGILDYLKIVEGLETFETIKFDENDIVRSDFVKEYIIAENKYFNRK